jgi:hypothetical protein
MPFLRGPHEWEREDYNYMRGKRYALAIPFSTDVIHPVKSRSSIFSGGLSEYG